MNTETMFEKATRMKLTFESSKGQLSIYDLWDVPLRSRSEFSLDTIAIALNKKVQVASEESFVSSRTSKDEVSMLKLDIVKHVISVKLEEESSLKTKALTNIKKARLQELIAQKQNDELGETSVEDLQKMLEDL